MSEYWNTRIKNLSPYVPGEQPKDRRFIKLNTNENPYPPSPKVIEAIQKAANESLRLYPDPECTEFSEAVAMRYGVKTEQVFAGNGSDEILAFAFGAFFESVKEGVTRTSEKIQPILFPDITYSFYPVYANLWDIPYKLMPLRDDFTINIDEYKINSGGVILPNPNAPTGIALPLKKILSLAEYLARIGKVFIVDEAYIAFSGTKGAMSNEQGAMSNEQGAMSNEQGAMNNEQGAMNNEQGAMSSEQRAKSNEQRAKLGSLSAVPHINGNPNMLTVHTLSKSASLAGLRAGFAIGNEKLIEALCRIRDSFNSYTMDRIALAGASAAVRDTAYYDEINGRVAATRERVADSLRDLEFTVLPSESNFLFIKPPCLKGADFFAALRENGILVRHFNKEKINDYMRVSIGTDEDMDTFLKACEKIIRSAA
jgi:histidinol-phosphate aminotransferase